MKINKDTVLVGEKVVLVPYLPEHVPTYHGWMLSEELRLLTASEPLSLEEEFDMQQKWLLDDDKLTFIILAREGIPSRDSAETPSSLPLTLNAETLLPSDPHVASLPMIGDVNIFFRGTVPGVEDHLAWTIPKNSGEDEEDVFESEVEIMIAEPAYRRHGCALEVLQLMLRYTTGAPGMYFGAGELASHQAPTLVPSSLKVPPAALVTRISESNTPSIRLFEKIGFRVTKRVEVFGEVEMRWFHKQ